MGYPKSALEGHNHNGRRRCKQYVKLIKKFKFPLGDCHRIINKWSLVPDVIPSSGVLEIRGDLQSFQLHTLIITSPKGVALMPQIAAKMILALPPSPCGWKALEN